jgi:glutamate-ammonia-ligase adenylyltransferase
MVQFAVLAWSHNHPEISRWSDSIRILESLAQSGLISEQQSSVLIDAYKRYRSAGHRLQLQNQLAEVSSSEFLQCRELVETQWKQLFKK